MRLHTVTVVLQVSTQTPAWYGARWGIPAPMFRTMLQQMHEATGQHHFRMLVDATFRELRSAPR